MAEEFERDRKPDGLERKWLVARYFFSRDTTATSSIESFCSTVAESFISLVPALQAPIDEFKGRPDFKRLPFKACFNGLVVQPLENLPDANAILIIDGLDECKDEHGSLDDLLDVINGQRSSAPGLRILVTGRPGIEITRWTRKWNIECYSFEQLEGSNKDVDLYIEKTLQEFPNIHATVKKLANGLFIWARIACDLILGTAGVNSLLEELKAEVSLDSLYKEALDHSLPKDERTRRVFPVVLQMILASREPLSIAELDKLAPEPGSVEQIVNRLGSLLVYQGRENPIRLLHPTFREFLTTKSKAEGYFVQPELGHHTLTLGCLKFMKRHDGVTLLSSSISEREGISFLAGYTLTLYLGFTFTHRNHGRTTVQHRIESWLWTPKYWILPINLCGPWNLALT